MPDRLRLPAPLLIAGASFLFSLMGLCVKLASSRYGTGEIVFYRSLVGLALMGALLKSRGRTLGTPVPAMHALRGLSGVAALCLWFYAIGGLPLATAMTLNSMSSVWMALVLIGSAVLSGAARIDRRRVGAVLAGFVGVTLMLRPTLAQQQAWHGLAGLASGLLSAMAYLQVSALGRVGEPEARVVFYFSLGGVVAGGTLMLLQGGPSGHSAVGLALLLAIGLLASMAQLMMTRAYAIGRKLTNAALQYLGIVFSFAFGVGLFHDPVTAASVAGMLLIIGAGLTATLSSPPARPAPAAHSTET